MTAKDPKRRREIASMGAKAQHKKYGCLIPTESRRKGGRIAGKKQKGEIHQHHGVTERLFDEWARSEGYKVCRDGFPDRVIEKDGETIFVEVKHDRDKLRGSQKQMHEILRRLGLTVIVWRPSTVRRSA